MAPCYGPKVTHPGGRPASLAVWIDVGLGDTSSLLVGLVGGIAIGACSLVIARSWLRAATPSHAPGSPSTGTSHAGRTMLVAVLVARAATTAPLLGTVVAE